MRQLININLVQFQGFKNLFDGICATTISDNRYIYLQKEMDLD